MSWQPDAEGDPLYDRPVFILSPPRSGSSLLFETLAGAPGLYTIGGESHQLIETIPELGIAAHGFASNRLLAADATPPVCAELRRRFHAMARDRDGRPPQGRFRLLEKTPKNALRLPFLMHVFPRARFVYLHREPREVLASMLQAWLSGRFRTYLDLPGWPAPYWSLLLTPGWQALAGKPLPDIVAAQWQAVADLLAGDLEQLPREHWCAVRYDDFVARPQAEIERLCDWLGLDWDQPLPSQLPLSQYTLTRPDPDKWREHAPVIEALLPRLQTTMDRVDRLLRI